MKLFKKISTTGILIAALALNGCKKSSVLEGVVKEEFGTATRIVESSGGGFGNESVHIGGLTYGLVLDSQRKTYTLNIQNWEDKPVIALAKEIERGDKVRIIYDDFKGESKIYDDGTGTIPSIYVEIIPKEKK